MFSQSVSARKVDDRPFDKIQFIDDLEEFVNKDVPYRFDFLNRYKLIRKIVCGNFRRFIESANFTDKELMSKMREEKAKDNSPFPEFRDFITTYQNRLYDKIHREQVVIDAQVEMVRTLKGFSDI